ncbi:hypothetical protein DL96DRAFT_1270911 [Flagelloscypha sp. PMI_526]|nr:hypothetical protein DL96DRAFT_1270911 [Flagelloscypha sp. PMI_526]
MKMKSMHHACFPNDYGIQFPVFPAILQERLKVLKVLSATCRSFRAYTLPLVYESIQVLVFGSSSSTIKRPDEHALAIELIEKLEVLTVREPYLGNYVTMVNVILTSVVVPSFFTEFAIALTQFPNLMTVEIMGCHRKSRLPLRKAFSKVQLPRVRRIALCPAAHGILPAIYNVSEVYVSLLSMHERRAEKQEVVELLAALRTLEHVVVLDMLQSLIPKLIASQVPFFDGSFASLQLVYFNAFTTGDLVNFVQIMPAQLRKLVAPNLVSSFTPETSSIPELKGKFARRFQPRRVPGYLVCKWVDNASLPSGMNVFTCLHWELLKPSDARHEWRWKEVTCDESRIIRNDWCCKMGVCDF